MTEDVSLRRRPSNNVLLALQDAQREFGYLSPALMTELARSLGVPENEVYGVATFYSFLAVRPPGRNVIRICQSLPCYLERNLALVETVEKELGIRPGESTPDKRFSLQLVNCIGLCDKAPAMLVNSDAHCDLTPSKMLQILHNYK